MGVASNPLNCRIPWKVRAVCVYLLIHLAGITWYKVEKLLQTALKKVSLKGFMDISSNPLILIGMGRWTPFGPSSSTLHHFSVPFCLCFNFSKDRFLTYILRIMAAFKWWPESTNLCRFSVPVPHKLIPFLVCHFRFLRERVLTVGPLTWPFPFQQWWTGRVGRDERKCI